MAYQILTDLCNACGSCEPECPNKAISHKGKVYTINPSKCQECKGTYDAPMCAQLCSNDACVPA